MIISDRNSKDSKERACPACIRAGKWHKDTGTPCFSVICEGEHVTCVICEGERYVPHDFGDI